MIANENKVNILDIPRDTFYEILGFCHTKTIKKLKEVCKEWFNLINASRGEKICKNIEFTLSGEKNKPLVVNFFKDLSVIRFGSDNGIFSSKTVENTYLCNIKTLFYDVEKEFDSEKLPENPANLKILKLLGFFPKLENLIINETRIMFNFQHIPPLKNLLSSAQSENFSIENIYKCNSLPPNLQNIYIISDLFSKRDPLNDSLKKNLMVLENLSSHILYASLNGGKNLEKICYEFRELESTSIISNPENPSALKTTEICEKIHETFLGIFNALSINFLETELFKTQNKIEISFPENIKKNPIKIFLVFYENLKTRNDSIKNLKFPPSMEKIVLKNPPPPNSNYPTNS